MPFILNRSHDDAVRLVPHGLEARHEDREEGAGAAQVDHLRPDARVQAAHALRLEDRHRLAEEGARHQVRQRRGRFDLGVERVGHGLLLDHGAADVGPAVHRRAEGSGSEAARDVESQLVAHAGGPQAVLEGIQGQEEAAGPEALAALHAEVADEQTAEHATGPDQVLRDVCVPVELLLLVELGGELDVLEGADRKDLREGGQRTREALRHRAALVLGLAEEGLVADRLEEELDRSGGGGPANLRHQALLHEAHESMDLHEALQGGARAEAGLRHAEGPHDVRRVHDDADDHRAPGDRRQRVQGGGLALARVRRHRCRGEDDKSIVRGSE
mmetsp:Transcript_16894/g.44668  ORF Transcript_16894/g.44668 Transcript_16894/m.44668 type:complete len:330 (+) Transcript_16894:403-1392(+)